MGKIIFILAAFLLLCVTGVNAYEITDMLGRKVEIPDSGVNRVIPLRHSSGVVAFLQAHDKVAAVERVDIQDVEKRPYLYAAKDKFANLPVVSEGGATGKPAHELIISLKPDVVFVITPDKAEADMLQRKLRTPVVVFSYGLAEVDFEKVKQSITLAAKILGREERGSFLVSYIDELMKELDYAPEQKAKAFVGGIAYKGTRGLDSTEGDFVPFRLANVENVIDKLGRKGHMFLQKEYLALMNPPLIFVDSAGYPVIEEQSKRDIRFFQRLKAFENGNVYLMPANTYIYRNIDLMLANAFFTAKLAYPGHYADLDPEAKAGEIIEAFTGENLYHVLKEDGTGFQRIRLTEEGMVLEDAGL